MTEHAQTKTPSKTHRVMQILLVLSALHTAGVLLYLLLRVLVGDGLWWLSLVHNFAPLLFAPFIVTLPLTLFLMRESTFAKGLLIAEMACFVIGILWFGPYFLPKAIATTNGTELTVVTFNIFPYNTQLDDVEAWLKEQNADIVFLQEIQPDETDEALASLNYPYKMMQSYENGSMILSRYPIIDSAELQLTGAWFDQDWVLQKAVIDIEGQQVALYNAHLIMPHQEHPHINLPFVPEFITQYDVSGRDQQINELIAYLDDETLPIILAGDFNMSDHAMAYNTLAAKYGDSFREAGQGFGWSWPAGASEEMDDILPPLVRLDYVWHSKDITAIKGDVGPKLGSDHLPMIVKLALPESATQ